ncbi:MAG: hypothetical protein FWG20_04675 [Candidatus Cloacimonetes bacterium]|nr:hypothetical protein [Candidatus Cloacimonadota bacterium]
MSITINNNVSGYSSALTDKLNTLYKKNVDEKVPVKKNSTNEESVKIRDISTNDIKQFLTADEKKVLREVFSDLEVDKNTSTPYSNMQYAEFLKGTQLDVKL